MTKGSITDSDDAPVAMPSVPSRVLGTALRSTVRPMMNSLPVYPWALPIARRVTDAAMTALAPVRQARIRRVRTHYAGRPVRGEWVDGRTAGGSDSVILYLHGGGFVMCSPRSHRGLVAELSARSGMAAFSVDYRLAPEHRLPSAGDDAMNAYRWLLANGCRPEQIVIAGDSAGGQLALGLVVALRCAGLAQPAGVVVFSPYVDTSGELAVALDARIRDPYLTAKLVSRAVKLYTETDRCSPRLLDADFTDLAPILVQAGDAEILADDARALAKVIRQVGGQCELQIWPGQIHVFQALYRFIPEARRALAQAGAFAARATAHHRACSARDRAAS